MGSRRIKIIVTLLAVAAIAAAFFLRPKRFLVDQTQYEKIPSPILMEFRFKSSLSVPSGTNGWLYTGSARGDRFNLSIHPDGHAQALSIPKEYRATPIGINDRGAIVGTVSSSNHSLDAFIWDPQRGFQIVPVRDAFPNANSEAVKINSKGMIVGHWERKQSYSKGVFCYDPNNGVFDIEPLSQISVSIGGMDEDGMIVGGFHSPLGHHAFLWTRQQGLVDIHPGTTHYINSRAMAINDNGWILVRAYNKDEDGDGEIVWIHRKLGKSRSFAWNYLAFEANPIPLTDRFTVGGFRPPWKLGRFRIRPGEWNNWILEPDRKPVLINPKVLSDKRWFIVGMDDQGSIVRKYSMDSGMPQPICSICRGLSPSPHPARGPGRKMSGFETIECGDGHEIHTNQNHRYRSGGGRHCRSPIRPSVALHNGPYTV